MDLFLEEDYRAIIKALFAELPNFGHGQASRLARYLGVNTTLVSQVLSGKKHFTEEQVSKTAQFLEFNKKESYYLLLLAQLQRTNSDEVKDLLKYQLRQLQNEAKSIKGRVSPKAELTFEQQAVYYSTWLLSAMHTIVSIEGFDTAKKISDKLGVPLNVIQTSLETLLGYGLIITKDGKLKTGPNSTYIPPDSPLVLRHHQNWRQLAGQKVQQNEPLDFYFTGLMSISESDFKLFRAELTELLAKLYKRVDHTKPEHMACLNIDFFKV